MFKIPSLVMIAGLIVGGAVVNGAVTQRWKVFEPDSALTRRLDALEIHYEDWKPTEIPTEMPVNEHSVATSRRYASPTSGRLGFVTLISGIPGSVTTHTPDVCYPGGGYKTLRLPKRETVEIPNHPVATYYVADFEKKTATKVDRVRVRWSWSTDGEWVAPDNPRWQFAARLARVPVLYKLYVVTPLPDDVDERPDDDAITHGFVVAALSQFASAFGK
jgi:hypothetical protein